MSALDDQRREQFLADVRDVDAVYMFATLSGVKVEVEKERIMATVVSRRVQYAIVERDDRREMFIV